MTPKTGVPGLGWPYLSYSQMHYFFKIYLSTHHADKLHALLYQAGKPSKHYEINTIWGQGI